MNPDPEESNEESPDSWVRDFANHLSWEFWLHDHAAASATALSTIFPGGIPEVSPQEAAAMAKEEFYQERMDQLSAQGRISQDQNYRRADQRYKYTQMTLKNANEWWKKVYAEKSTDTVAVALCNEDILIAANIKERSYDFIKKRGKGNKPVGKFGFHDNRFLDRIQQACEAYPQTRQKRIYLLMPKNEPLSALDNLKPHAEMQICRYQRQHPESRIKVIGVSKLACRKCREVMGSKGMSYIDRPCDSYGRPMTDSEVDKKLETANITNWLDPDTFEFGDVKAALVN